MFGPHGKSFSGKNVTFTAFKKELQKVNFCEKMKKRKISQC